MLKSSPITFNASTPVGVHRVIMGNVVTTFESGDEIVKGGHSNETELLSISWGSVSYALQDGSIFCFSG